jgi:hypothetical protein
MAPIPMMRVPPEFRVGNSGPDVRVPATYALLVTPHPTLRTPPDQPVSAPDASGAPPQPDRGPVPEPVSLSRVIPVVLAACCQIAFKTDALRSRCDRIALGLPGRHDTRKRLASIEEMARIERELAGCETVRKDLAYALAVLRAASEPSGRGSLGGRFHRLPATLRHVLDRTAGDRSARHLTACQYARMVFENATLGVTNLGPCLAPVLSTLERACTGLVRTRSSCPTRRT